MIGDIDSNVASSFVSSFADTRIGRHIKTKSDVKYLQTVLNAIYQWAVDNNMPFNSDKFESLRYERNTELQNDTHYTSNSGCVIAVKLV